MQKVDEEQNSAVPSGKVSKDKVLDATPSTRKVVATVVDCLLSDINSTSRLQLELAEKVGYGNGYEVGFAAGVKAAQRSMRGAIFGMETAAGLRRERECA